MTFKLLSLVGFSGKMLTEVITGGELVFDLDSISLCFLQDKFTTKQMRRRKRVMALKNDHNPSCPVLLNEWIKMFLFRINIFGKKVDFLCNDSFFNILPHAFYIDPSFGS
jgi:hypothetical protein